MRAGRLNRTISILSPASTAQDATGQPVVTWSTFAAVPASVMPITGREYFAAQQEVGRVDTRISIRYLSGVDVQMRVLYDSLQYDIEAVIDTDDQHREMVLMCSRVAT